MNREPSRTATLGSTASCTVSLFSTVELQKALADIEDSLYSSRFSQVQVDRPVFITSLPRGGHDPAAGDSSLAGRLRLPHLQGHALPAHAHALETQSLVPFTGPARSSSVRTGTA